MSTALTDSNLGIPLTPRIFHTIRKKFSINPMMFKELSQGVRSRAFITLFFALLLISLTTILISPLMFDSSGTSGKAAFATLTICLHLYSLLVGIRSFKMTISEVGDKTFELYTLAGMSPEKMILGKYFTSIYNYFFGVCCVAPFMFVTYFMRGVDFGLIIMMLFFLSLFYIMFYLCAICVAMFLSMTPNKIVVAGLGMLAIIYFMIAGIIIIAGLAATGSVLPIFPGFWLKDSLAIFFIFYFMIFALVFYLSCNLACAESDSREHYVKALVSISWVLVWTFMQYITGASLYLNLSIVMNLLFAIFMMIYWVNKTYVPIIVRNNAGKSRYFKGFHWLFEPGRRGSARTITLLLFSGIFIPNFALLFMGASVSPIGGISTHHGLSATAYRTIAVTVMMLLFWHIVIADRLFCINNKIVKNYTLRRLLMIMFWIVIGLTTAIFVAVSEPEKSVSAIIFNVVGTFFSPLLIPVMLESVYNFQGEIVLVSFALFIMSMILFFKDMRRTGRREIEYEALIGNDIFTNVELLKESIARDHILETPVSNLPGATTGTNKPHEGL